MIKKNSHRKSIFSIFFIIISLINLLIIAPIFSNGSSIYAASVQDKNDTIKLANESYHKGDFDKAISLIRQYLQNKTIDESNRIQAYSLLAKTFISKNENDKAKEVVRTIITLNPSYQPTLEQEKPSYVNLVQEVHEELKLQEFIASPKKTESKTWLWAGSGGVVAVAAIIAIIVSQKGNGQEKSNPLPLPPPFQ